MAVATSPPAAAPPASPPPLTGELRDVGAVLHESLRSQAYTAIGAVKVLGAATFGTADLRATFSVGTDLTAERLRSDGSLEVGRRIAVQGELSVRGSTRVGGALTSGDLHASGELEVGQSITVEGAAVVHGTLIAPGAITARSFEFEGTIRAPGLVECPMIQGRLRGPSRMGTIRSQNVRIVRAAFPFGSRGQLIVDRIEATEVELEGVSCEYLRAERVLLGAHCQITRVDGTVVRQHRTARVGPVAWEAPPPGLTR